MVNPFRTLLATVLAILIASPLCCCAVETSANSAPSCCAATERGDGIPDPAPHVCACHHAKDPRDLAQNFELPGASPVPLPRENSDLSHLAPPEPVVVRQAPAPRSGCDPPRNRFARLSRWLL